MARGKNRWEADDVTLSIIPPTRRYLEQLIDTGMYGSTIAEAAKIAMLDHIKLLIARGTLTELPAEAPPGLSAVAVREPT